MPQVPRSTEQQVQLNRDGIGYVRSRANPDTFGAGIGRAIQQSGRIVQNAGGAFEGAGRTMEQAAVQDERNAAKLMQVAQQIEDFTDRLDEAAAKEADNKLATRMRMMLHEGEEAYYMKKGKNALDALKPTQDALDKARKEIAKDLSPHQQKLFKDVADRRFQSEFEQMANYRNRQQTVYEDETSEARMINAIQDGQVGYNNPEARKRAMATGRMELLDMAQRNGWSPDVMKMQLTKFNTTFHAGVIDRMQLDNPSAAGAYLNAHQHEMAPDAVAAARKSIENADITVQAQQITDEIFASGGTIQEQLAAARKYEGKLEDQLVERVKQRWSEARNTNIPTDQDTWYELQQMSANEPDKFAALDLRQYRDKLNDSDFQELAKLQGKATDKDNQFFVRNQDEVIKDALRNVFKISPDADAKLNDSQKEFRQQYYREIQNRVTLWQANNGGKKPTPEDMQTIVDNYTLEVTYQTPGMLWGNNSNAIRIAEVTTEELPNIVPKAEIPKITQSLQKRGISNPSPSLIAQVYLQATQGK